MNIETDLEQKRRSPEHGDKMSVEDEVNIDGQLAHHPKASFNQPPSGPPIPAPKPNNLILGVSKRETAARLGFYNLHICKSLIKPSLLAVRQGIRYRMTEV